MTAKEFMLDCRMIGYCTAGVAKAYVNSKSDDYEYGFDDFVAVRRVQDAKDSAKKQNPKWRGVCSYCSTAKTTKRYNYYKDPEDRHGT